MLRATYVRTLKPGVTDQQFIDAWMSPGTTPDSYPARVTISHSLADEREIISIFEVDVSPEDFADALPTLVHPESVQRLAEIVESTRLEAVYKDTATFGSLRNTQSPPPLPQG
ncbi:MAG: hypothetical protein ACRDRL_18760 [Sciscionella sp.]